MAGQIKVDSINADSNLALKIANTAVAFIDATGLRPVAGNVNLDATATSKLYLPSANTVAIQTAGVTAVTVDSSQNVTLAGTLTTTGITNSGVATGARFNPTGSSVTGNGMYLPAANSLGLSTNGTNAVYIDSSQNVGIGTTSPQQKLHIQGTGQIRCSVGGDGTSTQYWKDATPSFIGAIGLGTPGTADQSAFVFSTYSGSWAERMRILSGGNVSIGTTSNIARLGVVFDGNADNGCILRTSTNASGAGFLYFQQDTNTCGVVTRVGTTSAVTYGTTSDYRLKENITPMTGALSKVARLKPVTYTWKSGGESAEGFIAHELAEVCPDAVVGTKDELETYIDEDGNEQTRPKYQAIDTSFLVATLTAAIQELKQINDTQAETINALTARIVALENR